MSDLEMSENEKNDIEVSDDEGSISNPIIKTTKIKLVNSLFKTPNGIHVLANKYAISNA